MAKSAKNNSSIDPIFLAVFILALIVLSLSLILKFKFGFYLPV